MNLELFVMGIPEPKGSKHIRRRGAKVWLMSGGNAAAHERLVEWAFRIRTGAERSMRANGAPGLCDEPIACDLTFYMPRPASAKKRVHCAVKPDLDKLCRAVFDPLIGVVITEDSRVVQLTARKVYADAENPAGVWVRLWSV